MTYDIRRGRVRMGVGFTTTCAWLVVLDTTICDKVYQLLSTGRQFPPPI